MRDLGHFYAQRRTRRTAQVITDLLVLGWCLLWGYLGILSARTVDAVADPLRSSRDTTAQLSDQVRLAAERAGQLPAVGDEFRKPLDGAAESLQRITGAAEAQIASIERAGLLLGWLVFVIPVVLVLIIWLPARIRFFLRARAAQRFIDARADLDLFALRAMVGLPMHVIARISDDPVAAWRQGDRSVIDALAALELRRHGLEPPTT